MAQIQNQDLIDTLRIAARISNTEAVPTELGKTIVPIVDATPYKFSQFCVGSAASATGTAAVTFPSVPLGGAIYITAIDVSLIKDATCDQATGNVNIAAFIDSTALNTALIGIPVITLTAQSERRTLSLPYPLKLKPNTAGSFTASYTAGVMSRFCRFYGFVTS